LSAAIRGHVAPARRHEPGTSNEKEQTMWVFLSGRLRRWVLMTVMLPVLGVGARKLGEAIEGRRGPNPFSSGLRTASSFTTRGGRSRAGRR
jgi:hypothetical protein